jgi:hypothetical protein
MSENYKTNLSGLLDSFENNQDQIERSLDLIGKFQSYIEKYIGGSDYHKHPLSASLADLERL